MGATLRSQILRVIFCLLDPFLAVPLLLSTGCVSVYYIHSIRAMPILLLLGPELIEVGVCDSHFIAL